MDKRIKIIFVSVLILVSIQVIVLEHELSHVETCNKYGYEVTEFQPLIYNPHIVCDVQPDINTSKFLKEMNEKIVWRD